MDDLLQTVREVAAEHYEVFGELGRDSPTDIWYLGRNRESGRLIALRLRSVGTDPGGKPDYELEVARELDGTVSVGMGNCTKCGAPIRRWTRFCTKCGRELGLGVQNPSQPGDRAALLEAVRNAAADTYDVLGEMPLGGGAGIVYFALEIESQRLVRLRLKTEGSDYVLGETWTLMPLADRISAAYVTDVSQPGIVNPVTPKAGDGGPPDRSSLPGLSQAVATGGRPARRKLGPMGLLMAVAVLLLLAVVLLIAAR